MRVHLPQLTCSLNDVEIPAHFVVFCALFGALEDVIAHAAMAFQDELFFVKDPVLLVNGLAGTFVLVARGVAVDKLAFLVA